MTTEASATRRASAYLLLSGLSAAGSIAGLLGATAAITFGHPDRGALFTGIFVSLFRLASALVSPWTPRLSARLGAAGTFAVAQGLVVITWIGLGVLVAATPFNVAFLLVAAPFLGVLSGVGSTLAPLVSGAYLRAGVAKAYSRRAVVTGLFAFFGALGAGAVITWSIPAVAIGLNGLLTAPLALLVWLRSPTATIPARRAPERPFRAAWRNIRQSGRLRPVVWGGVGATLFGAPTAAMVVPLMHDMRASAVVSGAGAVVAAEGAGKMLSPVVVSFLHRRFSDRQAQRIALAATALPLALMGASAALLTGPAQLAVWVLCGAGLGACLFSIRALSLGAASTALGDGRSTEGLAAYQTAVGLTAPLGTLLFGIVLSASSTAITMGVAAVGALAMAALASRLR